MNILRGMHHTIDRLGELPLWRASRQRAFDRLFESAAGVHLFRGVFPSFEAAAESAPTPKPLGYDNDESSSLYLQRLKPDAYDHPAMFWLATSMHQGMRSVVDIGGSVGIKYYAFRDLIDYPQDLRWRVVEVPAAVRLGREFSADKNTHHLTFTEDLASSDGSEVLFASGSLQYLPQSLPDLLATLAVKPRRIVVNTTPIHATQSFFTLNSIGSAYCPYRVQSLESFVEGVRQCGYRLRDQWQNIGKALDLPFNSEFSVPHYSGFCFDARL